VRAFTRVSIHNFEELPHGARRYAPEVGVVALPVHGEGLSAPGLAIWTGRRGGMEGGDIRVCCVREKYEGGLVISIAGGVIGKRPHHYNKSSVQTDNYDYKYHKSYFELLHHLKRTYIPYRTTSA
jgi:hypothetical protein